MRPAPPASSGATRVEIDVPDAAQLARRIDEIEEAAAEPAHRRNFQFAGADRLPEGHVAQPLGAVEGPGGVVHLEADGAHGRAMRDLIGVGKAVRIGVEDEVDGALRPARHRLRLVLPDLPEPEPGEQAGQRLRGGLADGELDELDAEAF